LKPCRSHQNLYNCLNVCDVVVEWVGRKQGKRAALLTMDVAKKRITLQENRTLLRIIDLARVERGQTVLIALSSDDKPAMMLIRVPKDYDLVSRFKVVCYSSSWRTISHENNGCIDLNYRRYSE